MNDMKQKDNTMRATPETDEATVHMNDACEFINPPDWEWVVTSNFAGNLERERDEARELARELREACEVMIIGICAAAIPHAGERATASLAVSEARKAIAKAKEVLGEA